MPAEQTSTPAASFEFSMQPLASAGEAFEEAAKRAQALVSGGLETFQAEASRYLQGLSTDNRDALDALASCRSPVEVLAAEQKWLAARAQAHLELGLRMAKAFADAATAAGTVLPAAGKAAAGPPGDA